MRTLFAGLLAAASLTPHAATPLTHNCKSNFDTGEVVLQMSSPTTLAHFLAVVANPALDPDLYARLWSPRGSRAGNVDWGVIRFDAIQDTVEIADALEADPVLRSRGLASAWANTATICFATMPNPVQLPITEYYNRTLGHYFLSSSAAENAILDSGGAGPGWEKTGERFTAIQPGACYKSYPVFRFYTFGANSHFFTANAGECGFLRRHDPGWIYEGDVFGAHLPVNGACPGRTKPVYRLYNNRWMFNDSNHRFVTRLDLYREMEAKGWLGEGLAFCVAERG